MSEFFLFGLYNCNQIYVSVKSRGFVIMIIDHHTLYSTIHHKLLIRCGWFIHSLQASHIRPHCLICAASCPPISITTSCHSMQTTDWIDFKLITDLLPVVYLLLEVISFLMFWPQARAHRSDSRLRLRLRLRQWFIHHKYNKVHLNGM